MRSFISRLGLLCGCVMLCGCSFGNQNYDQTGGKFSEPDDFVIQVDDQGAFWQPDIAKRALETIVRESEKTNTIVVLFIHGWHHNAQFDDSNAKDFAAALRSIRSRLDDNVGGFPGKYRSARKLLTDDGDVKIIGIYVGWRGISLPMPLNYLTFWGRKSAAERVGGGDLRPFLSGLNDIYVKRNDARVTRLGKGPFMGMTSFGHSFGGQVLFEAVAGTFEKNLREMTSAQGKDGSAAQNRTLRAFGDLVVLVNPAFEALQFEDIRTMNKMMTYGTEQTPQMVVLSSEGDGANGVLFPLGRRIAGLFGKPVQDDQRVLWRTTIGKFEPGWTHKLQPSKGPRNPDTEVVNYRDPCKILATDLTAINGVGGLDLTPIAGRGTAFSPFIIADVHPEIIVKHNGIFRDGLQEFLNDYVAITQAKRMLVSSNVNLQCARIGLT
jgi:hypothetical protein